jgi:hypothetical protein
VILFSLPLRMSEMSGQNRLPENNTATSAGGKEHVKPNLSHNETRP